MFGGTDCEASRETGGRAMSVNGTSISEAGVPKRRMLGDRAVRKGDEAVVGCAVADLAGISSRGRSREFRGGADCEMGGCKGGNISYVGVSVGGEGGVSVGACMCWKLRKCLTFS